MRDGSTVYVQQAHTSAAVHERGCTDTPTCYQINIDWAGILVERASGMKLNAYFQKNIFEPLGLKNISMFPNAEMKSQLATMHQRWGGGPLEERDHIYRRPLMAETEEEQDRIANSGGAGCFAKPTDYCRKPQIDKH